MQRVEPLAGNVVDLGKWDLAEGSADATLIDTWLRSLPSGLTRLVINWSAASKQVREALCTLAAKTTSLVDLSLMEEGARSLSVLQLNGVEPVEALNLRGRELGAGSAQVIGACVMVNASITQVCQIRQVLVCGAE